ncbi:DNA translocase ftsK domain protein, partial [Chlamydia psittaci 84-8471/1]|jgi:nucleotide-binding universal stress UspA family protein/uncharacterized membrane protein
MVV